MENNSFLVKLSKSKSAIILIVVVLISSIIATSLLNNYIFSEFTPDFYVEAIELDYKPIEFFPYSELDPWGIQAIFTENSNVEISFEVYVEINRMMKNYRNDAVEYDNHYYKLQFNFVDDTNSVDPIPLIFLS